MRIFGLIGWPLGHSFSKKYFSEKFEREGIRDARYALFPLENAAALPSLLAANPQLCGLNVTIPHKESVMPFLQELDATARAVGAVNCIKVMDGGRLKGYNTDVLGFEKSLTGMPGFRAKSACILGTGGAAKAVAFVLKKLGIDYRMVSRNPVHEQQIGYSALDSRFELLINATPIGTFPKVEAMPPLPPDFFQPGMFVYDLVYNPAETLLLREAKASGCIVKNGLEMLALQAEAAWEIWQNFDAR